MAYVQQLIHLEPEQKKAFLKRKKSGSGSISNQLRQAADMYLNSDKLNDSELELVSKLAKDAETTIEEMNISLELLNAKLDNAFAEIERLRGN